MLLTKALHTDYLTNLKQVDFKTVNVLVCCTESQDLLVIFAFHHWWPLALWIGH